MKKQNVEVDYIPAGTKVYALPK